MSLTIWLNGQLVPEEEAKISVFDHGLLYGDGVFEGIRAYNNRVFLLREHLDRLYQGAHCLCLEIPISREEMAAAVVETLRANNLREAYIRLVVTRGKGDLGLDPRKCPQPSVFIIATSIALYPPEVYTDGLRLITCATRRTSPDAFDPAIKSLNYLNNIMGKIETIRAGVPEGIMLDTNGFVSECTGDNIFLVRDNRLITPPTYIGNLDGITRKAVMELALDEGIEVSEELFRMRLVYTADEVFLTGTAAEIVPVVEVDGRKIADGKPGAMTQRLLDRFRTLTETAGEPIFV